MTLDAISGAANYDSARVPVRPVKTEVATGQDTGTVDMNISEIPAAVKTAGSSQTGKEQSNGQNEGQVSDKHIKNAISKANNKLKTQRTRCEFSYNEETKRVSIKMLDEDTQEVIKEIPPEETLEMIKKMWELAGLLIDERR